MDPTLLAAVRKLMAARSRAKAVGMPLAPEDEDAFIREETRGQFGVGDAEKVLAAIDTAPGVRNIGRALVQGATMNWGDEMLGILPEALGGGTAAKEEMRLRESLFTKAHPVESGGANVAGALALGLLTPGLGVARAGTGVLRGMAYGAGAGAAAGALSSAGAGETMGERARGAATGGAAGLALGAVLPGGIGVVKKALPATRSRVWINNAIERGGGADVVRAANEEARSLGRGDIIMLGDLSPKLQRATDAAANKNSDVWSDAAEKINARQMNMTDRILQDVRGAIGDPNARARAAKLKADLSAWAAGPSGYGGLRAAGGKFDVRKFVKNLNKPIIRDAWKRGRLAGDISEKSPADEMFQRLLAANPGVPRSLLRRAAEQLGESQGRPPRPITFDDAQQFKRYLDGKVGSAFTAGNGSLGEVLGAARDNVRSAISAALPEYAEVDAQYSAQKSAASFLQKGVDEWNAEDTRGFAELAKSLTPEELAEFRTGLGSKLIAKLRGTADNVDVARRLVLASDAMKDKLKMIFGDQYPDFMAKLAVEKRMAETRAAIGGSATALRLADAGFNPLEAAMPLVNPMGGAVMNAVRAVSRKVLDVGTERTAGRAGNFLLTQGSDEIEKLLAELSAPRSLFGKGILKTFPVTAGAAGPSLFGR